MAFNCLGFESVVLQVLNIRKIAGASVAGRVGFEPTICGSAGRRLGPGSTTGPRRDILASPYNGYNRET